MKFLKRKMNLIVVFGKILGKRGKELKAVLEKRCVKRETKVLLPPTKLKKLKINLCRKKALVA